MKNNTLQDDRSKTVFIKIDFLKSNALVNFSFHKIILAIGVTLLCTYFKSAFDVFVKLWERSNYEKSSIMEVSF
jgi:hypothetical protein